MSLVKVVEHDQRFSLKYENLRSENQMKDVMLSLTVESTEVAS